MEKTMKALILAAVPVLGSGLMVQAADTPPSSGNVCLRTIDIRDTTSPDDKTIIFHMNNGTIWRNDLRGICVGLRVYGFGYDVTPPDEICGNLQIIHVLHTHAACALGPFSKVPNTSSKQK
jgi:hypothetical protein